MSDFFNHLGSIWYQSEPLDSLFPRPASFLVWIFFCRFLQQDGSKHFFTNMSEKYPPFFIVKRLFVPFMIPKYV